MMKHPAAFSIAVRETLTAMLVTFMALKLCGLIDWSWWWITAPFWGGLAFVAALVAVFGIVVLAIAAFDR